MNIFSYLFKKIFDLKKLSIIAITILSLILSFFYVNISSRINAGIIQFAQKPNREHV